MKRREELDKYRDLSEEELQAETARLKESLFRLKFKLALGDTNTGSATTTAGRLRPGLSRP
ncbi:MAG: 50S ribosomal protein L29 [Acidobacteria bacterium]|nr:50S ribosomal protein L29 [Acidobacteriota bacterium]